MQAKPVSNARRLIIALGAVLFVGAAISLYASLDKVDSQYRELARSVAESFSDAILVAREWNTQLQGVYAPVSSGVHPDEFLNDPLRDIISDRGIQLTKINHAEMTRMIGELLSAKKGIHMHLTSLTPIRPQNGPDPWERKALADFTEGKREAYEVLGDASGGSEFRYMAPLRAESTCLRCHLEHKGENEIRGGMSVSFNYGPFQQLMYKANRQIWLVHLTGSCASLVLIIFLGRNLVQNCAALQSSLDRVRQLEGLVPVCANCKQIRTEGTDADMQKSWVPMEVYIEARTNAQFSHGLCPDCREKLYPGLAAGRKT